MENKLNQSDSNGEINAKKKSPLIVSLGAVQKLTGQQPRGHKKDGGTINKLKNKSESPVE